MKTNHMLSRRILSFLVVALMMQHAMPLVAQQSNKDKDLSTLMQKFKKSVQCALSKKGCTEQEAQDIRLWAGSIIALLLILIASGLYYKFGRKKQSEESKIQVPGSVPVQYGVVSPIVFDYEQRRKYLEKLAAQQEQAKAALQKRGWWPWKQ